MYIEPTVSDVAVLLAFYNPAGFNRILKNMQYVIKCLTDNNIPYFLVECVFKGAKPQFPKATLVLHSDSYMFYKEQLINKLEPKVPAQFTKLAIIDGDIIFDSPDWIDQTSKKLDEVDIIQPFSEACWLTPNNTKIRSRKPSYAKGLVEKKLTHPHSIHMFHPGFAWAFKRSTFQNIGGFYDRAVIGNGDMLFVFNFFKDEVPDYWIKEILDSRFILDGWPEYHAKFKAANPSIGFLENKALHLFHGVRQHRQYTTRYRSAGQLLKDKTWDQEIVTNADGLFEFKTPAISDVVHKYFKRRNEDIPLDSAEHIVFNMPTRRRRRRRFNIGKLNEADAAAEATTKPDGT
jgi:hypothetical protein